MSDSMAHLRRKISTAGDLQSVVRTMKAMAASSVEQYERSVLALHDYYHTVELGLSACFRNRTIAEVQPQAPRPKSETISAIVFGSDQGLVGRFNDVVADYAIKTLSELPGKPEIWSVGERVHDRLADSGTQPKGPFPVPNSVKGIAPLVGRIQVETITRQMENNSTTVYLFHNRPQPGSLYEPVAQRMLPLDSQWQERLTKLPWPTQKLPEILNSESASETEILQSLFHEYLFISLFRACAESLASENASRLTAMQRADKNIDELLETLHTTFHRQRQASIDEELFDVVSGFEALSSKRPASTGKQT